MKARTLIPHTKPGQDPQELLLEPLIEIKLMSGINSRLIPTAEEESRLLLLYRFGLFLSSELLEATMIYLALKYFQRPLHGYLPPDDTTNYSISATYFVQDAFANWKYFDENFRIWENLVRKHRLPTTWEPLNRCEAITAGVTSVTLSSCYSIGLGFAIYQMLSEADYAEEFSIAAGCVYGHAALIGAIHDLKEMRNLVHYLAQYCCKIKCNISLAKVLAWLLTLNSFCVVTLMNFDATVSALDITDDPTKTAILGITVLASASTLSNNAKNNADVLEDFFTYLRQMICPSPSKILFFLLAAYFTSLIMDSSDPYYSARYREELLPYIDFTEPTVTSLGFMGAISQMLPALGGTYALLDKTSSAIRSVVSSCRRPKPIEEKKEEKKPIPSLAHNPHLIFAPPPRVEPIPESKKEFQKHCCTFL